MMDAILKELEEIRLAAGGVLKCEDVVAFAENPDTALHSRFTWDDSEAAKRYRLWQAREVVQIAVTVLPGSMSSVRAYVSLGNDRKEGGGYRPMVEVLKTKDMRDQLMAEALSEFRHYRKKYETLKELAPVFAAMDDLQQKDAAA